MTIPVVCECGFRKQVPNEWEGMRIQCKCGRSFVISADGNILEPPVADAPRQADQRQPPKTTTTAQASASNTATRLEVSADRVDHSVAARYRSRHNPAEARKRIIFGGGTLIALLCLVALAIILPQQLPSGWKYRAQADADWADSSPTATTEHEKDTQESTHVIATENAVIADSADETTVTSASPGEMVVLPSDDSSHPDTGELSDVTGHLKTRIAELIELGADEGLLLTGMFGQEYKQLEITQQQQTQIDELTEQLKTKEEELNSGSIELDQWYTDGEKIGTELLQVLTDAQRGQLREMIQREKIKRVPIEEYAARLRPELRIPRVAWKIEPDSVRLPVIKTCEFAGPAQEGWYRPQASSGIFAVANSAPTQPGTNLYQCHSLLTDQSIGKCEIPQQRIGHTTLLSPDGRYLVVDRQNEAGVPVVEVWSTQSGRLLASKELPRTDEKNAETLYVLRDCVADQVCAISGTGYWVWNFNSGQAREVPFPDWVSHDLPASAMSPGGRYVAVAHLHAPSVQSRRCHFMEVCVYELETGDLLGNQVVATDYRELSISAIMFNYDGQELAVLWNVSPLNPQRVLIHMNAINGEVLRTVDGLLPPTQGYAWQHELQQRDLICLPDNSGWIVNLHQLVESESGALIDMELPQLQNATETPMRDPEAIVEAIPAGDGRLLLVIVRRTDEANALLQLRCQFIQLPEMGPFM